MRLTYKNGPKTSLLKSLRRPVEGQEDPSEVRKQTEVRRASPGITDAPLSSDDDDELELPEPQHIEAEVQQKRTGSQRALRASASTPQLHRTTRKNNGQLPLSSSPKRPAEDDSPDPLSHDAFDLFGSSASQQGQRRAKKMKSYGTSGAGAGRSISMVVQTRPDRLRKAGPSRPGDKFKRRGVGGFKAPLLEDDMDEQLRNAEETSPPSKFKNPTEIYAVPEPRREDQKDVFKIPKHYTRDDDRLAGRQRAVEEKTSVFKVPAFLPEDDDPLVVPGLKGGARKSFRLGGDMANGAFNLRGGIDESVPTSSATETSTSSAAVQISLSSDSSPLSSPPESPLHDTVDLSDEAEEASSVCPMCKQRVAGDDMKRLMSGVGRLSVRKQAEFCRGHQVRSAREEWQRRQYPTIDWDDVSRRIEGLYPEMEDLLRGKRRSIFREALEGRIKTGAHRTLKQSMMTHDGRKMMMMMTTTGYYGPRGAQLFAEKILARFSNLLRQLAGRRDAVLASRGVSEYIQAVLVPELAVLLVRQDLGVDADRAREVLRESNEMGELMNDE